MPYLLPSMRKCLFILSYLTLLFPVDTVQCVKMSWTFSCAIFISGLVILSWIEVDAQSTVDDSGSCESSTFDEAVNFIREDLKDVKNLLGSNYQQNPLTELSSSKQTLAASLACEYRTRVIHFR